MILYIDETENNEIFVVAGLLVKNQTSVHTAYKHFKKQIQNIYIPDKYKGKVYTEFKSTLLDRDYKRIKRCMLEEIYHLECEILYSVYQKKQPVINQIQKESIYITLLSSILASQSDGITVIFDRFGKKDFEERIVKSALTIECVDDIHPEDSQREAGLQFIDNICSVIRRHISGKDNFSYFEIIKDLVTVI